MQITLKSDKNIFAEFEAETKMEISHLRSNCVAVADAKKPNDDHSWPVQVRVKGGSLGYIERKQLITVLGRDVHAKFLSWEDQLLIRSGGGVV